MRRWRYLQPELKDWEWKSLTGSAHDKAHSLNHYHRVHREFETGFAKIICILCKAYVVLEQNPTTSRGYTIGGTNLLEEKCDPMAAQERIQKQRFEAIMMKAGESP